MKHLIHAIDWIASIVLGYLLFATFVTAVRVPVVFDNEAVIAILGIAAAAWFIGRVMFKRLNSVA